MPTSFRDDDKILERPVASGSKGGWIAVGVVVYLLGVFTGMQVAALMGGGSCPTGPTGGSVAPMAMPAPRTTNPPMAPVVAPARPPAPPAGEASAAPAPPAALEVGVPPADSAAHGVADPGGASSPLDWVAPPVDPNATFALQVRTFDNLEEAGGLVRQLQAAGYPAYVVTTHLPDGAESHRVRVGDYPDRATAEAAAAKISAATALAPFVTLTLR